MTIPNIKDLNKNFSFDNKSNRLSFKMGNGDIPLVEIANEQASAIISLQGAHVLSWIAKGDGDVIWLSEDATFAMGKSIRGGIPVCWPWFGAHNSEATFPAHGFARTVLWQVTDSKALDSGETQITFNLDTTQLDKRLQQMWPQATVAEYRLTIGKTLTLELITFNHSDQAITLGQALHTYFNINDVSQTTITGLDGRDYLDKTDDFKRKSQTGPITINSEVDRVYLQTADDITIDDGQRKIHIKKQGSHSTVVWNPWQEVAEKMADLGQDGYRHMVCVESANAAEDTVSIQPGKSQKLLVTYEVR